MMTGLLKQSRSLLLVLGALLLGWLPFAIVYAYGGPNPPNSTQNVSYGYPAGLSLEAINPVE